MDLCLKKTQAEKYHDLSNAIVYENSAFESFSVHTKVQIRRLFIPPV